MYEDTDDYGFGGTWDSREYGSAGPRIACCTITPYWIKWEASDDLALTSEEQQALDDERDKRRKLARELYGEDVEEFTPDQFRELFGEEPVKMPGEDDWLTQN